MPIPITQDAQPPLPRDVAREIREQDDEVATSKQSFEAKAPQTFWGIIGALVFWPLLLAFCAVVIPLTTACFIAVLVALVVLAIPAAVALKSWFWIVGDL